MSRSSSRHSSSAAVDATLGHAPAVKVLIVEDEALVALDLVGRLGAMGYEVSAVTDRGDDAVRIAHERRPDVILMDIHLKGEMDGTEAATQIYADLDTPVVFLTAYGDEETLNRVEAATPYGYLMKPVADSELSAAVRMALFRHEMESRLRAGEEKQRRLAQERAALLELAELASSSLDVDEVIERILPAAASLLGLQRATYVCPAGTGMSVVCQCFGPDGARTADGRKCDRLHASRSSHLPRMAVHLTDMATISRHLVEELPQDMMSALFVPVGDGDAMLGGILLDEPGLCVTPTESMMRLAVIVGRLTTTAMTHLAEYRLQKTIASTLQDRLRPMESPALSGFDVAVRYVSATEGTLVGGDFYDFFALGDGRVALVLGDVSGKGLQAAIDTAKAKYAVRALAVVEPEPASLMSALNETLAAQLPFGKFITMLYCLLDPGTGDVTCASAGHPQPVIYRPGDGARSVRPEDGADVFPYGVALGVSERTIYSQVDFRADPGEYLVMFTDGLTEARPPGSSGMSAMIGFAGVLDMLNEGGASGAHDVVDHMYRRVMAHSGGALRDDLALLVVGRTVGR